jgi:hypothetical protein
LPDCREQADSEPLQHVRAVAVGDEVGVEVGEDEGFVVGA